MLSGKIMGIDYGTKRIGIALSDEGQQFAFPSRIIPNQEKAVDDVLSFAGKEGVTAIVVGESKDFKNEENPVMRDIRRFVELLERNSELPVHLEEEFMTSSFARRVPQASDEVRSRKERKSEPVDSSAAALILQSYLDKQHNR